MSDLPSIEICIACTWFQKRLCWMLSSLLQQEGDVPNLVINIAYPKNNGTPATEEVCRYFKTRGLTIKQVEYDGMDRIQYRGLVRNDQLARVECDWVLFADSDMVYHPNFFDDVAHQLATRFKDEKKLLSSSRISLSKDYCKNFFNNLDRNRYPCEIDGVANMVEGWDVFQISKNVGAGYFQLANMQNIRNNLGGIYVPEESCRDWSWFEKGQKANSDRQFRKRIGGMEPIKTLPQWHLNHERDNEAGEHLTIQR